MRAVPPVTVVSDTTGYLPRDVVEESGMRLVSLYVNFDAGERTEREIDMPDFDRFYDELRSAQRLPTTSQPSVGDFVAAYEPLLVEGHDIVSVHISAGLSGTFDSARQEAAALEREGKGGERVRVIDSVTAAGGLGLIALAAARRAAAGGTLEEVVAHTERARETAKVWVAMDTLEYLRRGGRIGAARAWVGSTLRVKPIITIESETKPLERVRTASRAFERLVDYARQRADSGPHGWLIQHARAHEQAERLAERCREVFGTEPVCVSEIGPVIGVHAGPGMLGLAAIAGESLDGGAAAG